MNGTDRRYCGDCDDETPHRQIGDSTAPGPTYRCLACPERIEIEAALGIGYRSTDTGTERGDD